MTDPKLASHEERDKSLHLSSDDLVTYLNKVAPDAKCSFCGKGDYGVGSLPENQRAVMVATPVAGLKGVGVWFYPVACVLCGHTIFFSATHVSKALARG